MQIKQPTEETNCAKCKFSQINSTLLICTRKNIPIYQEILELQKQENYSFDTIFDLIMEIIVSAKKVCKEFKEK